MPHTRLGQQFLHALRLGQIARRHPHLTIDESIDLRAQTPKRSNLLSRRRFMQATAALGASALLSACRPITAVPAQPSIVIVGAGLAGLNAAYQLKKTGYRATIYEASNRVGGRIFTVQNVFAPGLSTDYGAELIDSGHADMHSLIQEFGLSVADYEQASEQALHDYFYFDGKVWPERTVAQELAPIVARLYADADRLENDWERAGLELDRLSVAAYLDRLGVSGWIRRLMQQVITSEFGLEIDEMTVLHLLWLIPIATEDELSVLGESDERYHLHGGSQRLTDAMAATLQDQIHTGRRLEAIRQRDKGYTLTFQGVDIEADYVILTLPFSLLRQVEMNVTLPETLRRFIHEVGYGHNAKVMAGYRRRIWREQGLRGLGYSEDSFQNSWDSSLLQPGETGVIIYYLGGNEGLTSNQGTAQARAEIYTRQLDKIIPGLLNEWNGSARRMHWPSYSLSKGSYACFRPGQYTEFIQHHVYREEESEAQSVAVGNLFFAGEHLSDKFQGYMNGAAQTGRLAVKSLLDQLS
jgi:monoamine oxidase